MTTAKKTTEPKAEVKAEETKAEAKVEEAKPRARAAAKKTEESSAPTVNFFGKEYEVTADGGHRLKQS